MFNNFSESLSRQMLAKGELLTQTWEQASLSRETRLGLTFGITTELPSGLSKHIQQTIRDDLQRNLYAGIPRIEEVLNEAMESPVWSWNGLETVRKNGEIVTNPRNIVDTRALSDSLVISTNGLGIVVSYNTPYAAIVHYGGITWNGGQIQSRPWAQSVLVGGGPVDQVNWAAILQGR